MTASGAVLIVLGGSGMVLREGAVTLWASCQAGDPATGPLDALVIGLAGVADHDAVGDALALALAGLAASRPGLSLAALVDGTEEVRLVLAGDAVLTGGPDSLAGGPLGTRVYRGAPAARMLLGSAEGVQEPPLAGVAQLRAGVITGGGFLWSAPVRVAPVRVASVAVPEPIVLPEPVAAPEVPDPVAAPEVPEPVAVSTRAPIVVPPPVAVAPLVPPPVAVAPPVVQAPAPVLPAGTQIFELRPAVAVAAAAPLPLVAAPVLAPPAPAGTGAPPEPAGDPDAVQVSGVICSRGHFNHPAALYCGLCGVAMVHETRIARLGPRPSLGVLIVDDGTVLALQKGWLLGSMPNVERAAASRLQPLALADPQRAMETDHTIVRLQDWDVLVEDCGTRAGTWIAVDSTEWHPVRPGAPAKLLPGNRLLVGRRSMTFESALRR